MMRKHENLILTILFFGLFLCSLFTTSMPTKTYGENVKENSENDSVVTAELVDPMDSIKRELITEVENYVFTNFPKVNKTIPTAIVENGLEHEVDILFMMAQTQIETHYGTLGAGRETSRRSLFGVALRKYESYEKAIKDYIAILKKNYLTRGRTEQHLMRRYTTTRGGRYAENPNYEVELRGAYNNIDKKTNIKLLQEKYKKINLEKRTAML